MTERTASRTAAGVAWLRAAHQLVDDEPCILDDPIAPRLLGPAGRRAIDERRADLFTPSALALRAHVLLPSRFTEDLRAEASRAGMGQYVILGSGLDTFAYRQPGWARSLRICEVDQPAGQRVKRQRLAVSGREQVPGVVATGVHLRSATLRRHPVGRRAAEVGEPWQTFFTPVELESVLRSARFSAVRSVSVEDAARYFAGRHDALAAPRRVSIAVATV